MVATPTVWWDIRKSREHICTEDNVINASRSRRRALLGLVVAFALAGAGLPTTIAAQNDQSAVNIIEPSPTDIVNWGYDNQNLTISAGQTVTWSNTGAQQHTVTADDTSLDSGLIDPGNTFSFEFDTPGVYTYHCTPHPWMKASVTVTG
jgi:plastocyanin